MAVSASISTPVLPVLFTVVVISTVLFFSFRLNSILISPIRTGWHRGIKLGVCLAAIMPASWATARTSPFAILPFFNRSRVEACILTVPLATASRLVSGLPVTSTIRGRPEASICVSSSIVNPLPGRKGGLEAHNLRQGDGAAAC